MQAIFYVFSKRSNSTLRPTAQTQSREFQIKIKDASSILTPNIELNLGKTENPQQYNYAYIPAFSRYYFVQNWVYYRGIWTAYLQVDVLATWKNNIAASTEYVLRSASEKDGRVVDLLYPTTAKTVIDVTETETPWTALETPSNGVIIVGVAGARSGHTAEYYAFNLAGAEAFFANLFSDTYVDSIVGVGYMAAHPEIKLEVNPIQYIISVKWFPFDPRSQLTSVSSIDVGYATIPTVDSGGANYAWRIPDSGDYSAYITHNLAQHQHPQAVDRGEFLNAAPYTEYAMYFPPIGIIDLDPTLMANSTSVQFYWHVDLRTGSFTLTTSANGGVYTSVLHGTVGITMPLTQIVSAGFSPMSGVVNFAQALGGTIANIASSSANQIDRFTHGGGNVFSFSNTANQYTEMAAGTASGLAGIVSATSQTIGDYYKGKIPSATTIGNYDGADSLYGLPAFIVTYHILVDDDNEHRGRPLCKRRQIGTLSGYIQVADPDLSIPAPMQENNAVKEYMENGFYYE